MTSSSNTAFWINRFLLTPGPTSFRLTADLIDFRRLETSLTLTCVEVSGQLVGSRKARAGTAAAGFWEGAAVAAPGEHTPDNGVKNVHQLLSERCKSL